MSRFTLSAFLRPLLPFLIDILRILYWRRMMYLQVDNAKNVPIRARPHVGGDTRRTVVSRSEAKSGSNGQSEQDREEEFAAYEREEDGRNAPCNVLVEISFQGRSVFSNIQEGPAPLWKEMLVLPFVPPLNDFSPHRLRVLYC